MNRPKYRFDSTLGAKTNFIEEEKTMKRTNRRLEIALTLSVAALLVYTQAYAQHAGGSPGSVVFYSARDGHSNNQIYVMDPDGSGPARITYDVASDMDPDISPNGQQIVFTSNQTETGNNDIFVRDRSGVVRNLTNDRATDEWARWSPDGKQIVFDSNRDGGVFEIYVMNADGSGTPTRLTSLPYLAGTQAGRQTESRSCSGTALTYTRSMLMGAAGRYN